MDPHWSHLSTQDSVIHVCVRVATPIMMESVDSTCGDSSEKQYMTINLVKSQALSHLTIYLSSSVSQPVSFLVV